VLRVGGYRFFFYSREGHEPPHIHVQNAERYAKFWLAPVSLAWARGFRGDEIGEIRRLVQAHSLHFQARYHAHIRKFHISD
jgi:hypothetical protein